MNKDKDKKKDLVADSSGIRLDKFMAKKIKFSRSKIKRNIKKGRVLVNGKSKSAHYSLKEGDRITYKIKSRKKDHITPQNIPLNIVKEKDGYIILNKSPDMVVHPAPGNPDGTLLNGLFYKYKSPALVHRLDKDTSGVMIAALNEESALNIKKQFKKKKVKKVYLALLEGVLKDDAGEIAVPIKRDPRDRTKMRAGWVGAKKSVTRYRVKKRFNNATYVEVFLLTGRTHQIRVHFSHLGHPVLGDRKYGTPPFRAPRQMLHAWQISFEEPSTGERVNYKVEPPADFKNVLNNL